MNDPSGTNTEMIEEISVLKQRIRELEQSEAERKQAEEELRKREARYRTLFEQAAVGVAEIEIITGRFLTVNRRLCELVGRTEEELLATTYLAITHPDDLQLHEDKSALLLAGKIGHYTLEKRYISKDGAIIWVNITVSHPWKPGEKSGCNIVVVEDITERRRAEDALQEKTEELDRYFSTALDLFCIADTDGCFRHLNRQWEVTLGYSLVELEGRRFLDFVHPDDMESTLQAISRLDSQEQVLNFVNRYRCKDGSYRWIEWRSSPRGKLIYAAARDITERKRAEEELRESEERFRALSENAPDIIYTVNLDGTITYVNPSWMRVLGHGEEDLLGRYFTDFAREEDRRAYRKLLKGVRDDRKNVHNYIGVMLAKDGTERVFNMNSAFNRDSKGHIIGVVGTMKDITELRDMEKKLNHAQKMEAVGTLAGGIAHDFNNLLMGIQGYTSLTLLDLDPSHPHYERLKRIEEQVQSGADLTRQLLGFASGGRYEVKPADMNDILKKSSSMFGRTKKEITIHRKYGKDLSAVEVDRGQMEQVFMNLYVNAWQAMPGGGEIYLETENVLLDDEQAFSYAISPGRYVKISVTDTGTGMDDKTRERIFDPFFTTKGMGRGTGLGLATVYGIIKGHKGAINVDSEPGHGTTFNIYLPASEREVVKEKTETGAVARGTETILLVDDEKMVLEVSREMLESMGYRVYAAGSGPEALAVYLEKRKEIDLVILDMIMPGISGGETFDRLREINSAIKVLLSSGYSINGEASHILDRGCNGFLQKPFHLEKLSDKVREMLEK
ncbi:MAG: PAS domain S-box protein [Deltaproteobacteria bacterium]|nr:PAS domain S-box protein [Deltaproteobacteria bacterium]